MRLNALDDPFHAAHDRVWQAPCHDDLGDTSRARALLAEVPAAPEAQRRQVDAYLVEAASIIEVGDPVGP